MQKNILVSLILACALLGLLPERGHAWGAEGHRIVCEIAWQRLTPDARGFVAELLRGEADPIFSRTCTWADAVRPTTHRHTAPYHYINIPAGAAGMDLERDCGVPGQRCITWAIHHYSTILTDRSRPQAERNEALKFLAHFVGDLHQPLHAGRPEDRGGNDVPASFFGDTGTPERPLNLHSVWDSAILRQAGHTWPDAALWLDSQITRFDVERWSTLDVVEWTNESFRIADRFVYPELPADGFIGNRYYRPALGYSEVQLQKAGVRLALLLEHIAHGTLRLPPLEM